MKIPNGKGAVFSFNKAMLSKMVTEMNHTFQWKRVEVFTEFSGSGCSEAVSDSCINIINMLLRTDAQRTTVSMADLDKQCRQVLMHNCFELRICYCKHHCSTLQDSEQFSKENPSTQVTLSIFSWLFWEIKNITLIHLQTMKTDYGQHTCMFSSINY